MNLEVDPHPLFAPHAVRCVFPVALEQLARPASLEASLAAPGVARDEDRRARVRAMLRHGGYKPSGRGKPSSEYLLRVASEGALPRINPVVDLGNLASVESGLPISVVDLGRTTGQTLRLGLAPEDASYVFNASGQEIALGGLLCLFDGEGPCANAVKDAQRTKTAEDSTEVLFVIWAPRDDHGVAAGTLATVSSMARDLGARTVEQIAP